MRLMIFSLLMLSLNMINANAAKVNVKAVTLEVAGTKIWIPSVINAYEGDHVRIEAVSKVGKGKVHGFMIEGHPVKEVVSDKKRIIEFVASKPGIYPITCHLHPAHIGGQLVVLKK